MHLSTDVPPMTILMQSLLSMLDMGRLREATKTLFGLVADLYIIQLQMIYMSINLVYLTN